MSDDKAVDRKKIQQRIYNLLKDTATKKISVEMFIDGFVPLFATYGEELFKNREYDILDNLFQEAPYFVPIIYLRQDDSVLLDIRKYRDLVCHGYREILSLAGSTGRLGKQTGSD